MRQMWGKSLSLAVINIVIGCLFSVRNVSIGVIIRSLINVRSFLWCTASVSTENKSDSALPHVHVTITHIAHPLSTRRI